MLGLLGVLGAYPAHLPPLLVVGPASARDWLAEAAPGLRLRYSFAHCLEVNNPGAPSLVWGVRVFYLNSSRWVRDVDMWICVDSGGGGGEWLEGWRGLVASVALRSWEGCCHLPIAPGCKVHGYFICELKPHPQPTHPRLSPTRMRTDPAAGHWARRQLAERLGIMQLESVGVRHCSDAYGVVVGHRCGWKLLYSGDTQPCDRLVQV